MTTRDRLRCIIDRYTTCTWVDREMLIDEILRLFAARTEPSQN
jgi:hypothetical protein